MTINPGKTGLEIKPSQIVKIFKNNPLLQAKLLLKEFIGLQIKVSGIIKSIKDVGGNYVTFNFYNEADNVFISANFDKPAKQELLVLDKGEKIKVSGEIFNAGEDIVVLDHCELIIESDRSRSEKIFINNVQFYSGSGDNVKIDKIKLLPKQRKTILENPWIVGVGTTVIASIIVYYILGTGENKIDQPIIINSENAVLNSEFRDLSTLETGKTLRELPNNIRGYSMGIGVVYAINEDIQELKLTNIQKSNWYFEIRKSKENVFLVGFISEENFSKIGTTNMNNPLSLTLFGTKWREFDKGILIPVKSIKTIKDRFIDNQSEEVEVLDIITSEVLSF